jgi:hypothetical protein
MGLMALQSSLSPQSRKATWARSAFRTLTAEPEQTPAFLGSEEDNLEISQQLDQGEQMFLLKNKSPKDLKKLL